MPSEKKFLRFLVLVLVLFTVVSLTLVLGILYGILSSTMSREFDNKLESQQAAAGMILKDRLHELETQIREMSLNNTVRVSLMLGVKSQLLEVIKKQYPNSNGAFYWVQPKQDPAFIPELPMGLWSLIPDIKKLSSTDRMRIIRFKQPGYSEYFTLFTNPIMRKSDRLGTAYVLHSLARDNHFWTRIKAHVPGRLLIQDQGYLVDLHTCKATPLPKEFLDTMLYKTELPWLDIFPEESLILLKDFSGIFFAASSVLLREKKTTLIITLAVLSATVFFLTILVAFLISRRVSEPLENMSNQALEIAQEPTHHFLEEENIKYIEFRKLAQAFNRVLLSLLETQEELKTKARLELDASEERYRRILEAAPDSITITGMEDGRYLQVNEAFRKIIGYSREEVLGKTPFDLNLFVNPADRERLVEKIKNKGKVNSLEIQYRHKAGVVIDTLLSARQIQFDGKDCLIVVATDITRRKRIELEKARLERKLQQSQKMEAIGTLAGGVAHDLNNILSGIVSYPELILLDLPEDSPLRESILTIQESGHKAATIVQDLLTLARRGVAVTEVVNLNQIIAEYLESPEYNKMRSFYHEVQMETRLETDLLNIIGSPVHLSKTIMNLVSNAVESMPEGGPIFIRTENRYIDMPIKGYDDVKEGDYAVLIVSDTGTGISSDDLPRIFEPFYTKKVMGRSGTGLGMSVVWGTVRDHKGYIDIQSTEGKGTTFTIYFPVTREKPAKDKSRLSIEDYMGKGQSILVVDDVKEQRKIASGMLEKLGYSVAAVSSGKKAVEYMKTNSADLLILDMIMDPGIDGLETFKRILKRYPGQKAIIASGFSETDRVKEAQDLGAGEYIKKPYTLEKIGLAVKKELANRNSRSV